MCQEPPKPKRKPVEETDLDPRSTKVNDNIFFHQPLETVLSVLTGGDEHPGCSLQEHVNADDCS